MYNKITIIGKVVTDIKHIVTDSGTDKVTFMVMTMENEKETKYCEDKRQKHKVACWDSIANHALDKIKKGLTVIIEGKLITFEGGYEIACKVFKIINNINVIK